MALTARPGTFAVRLGGDVVILDVAADTYSCLFGVEENFARDGVFGALSADQIGALVADGVLVDTVAPVPRGDASALSRRLWCDLPHPVRRPVPRVRDWVAFLVAHRSTRRLLRGDSLLPALSAATRLAATPSMTSGETIALAVARYDAMAIWLPRRGECLVHALALMHFLRRAGIATEWVFGVHLFPFRAHCWLASGEYVVGDASHRVLAFSPIMTVTAERG